MDTQTAPRHGEQIAPSVRTRLVGAHPLLVAVFPPFFLWSHNITAVPGFIEILPLTCVIGATALLWLVLWFFMRRDWQRSAIVASWIVLLFFSFNGIVQGLLWTGLFHNTLAQTIVLIFLAVSPLILFFLVTQKMTDPAPWTYRLNWIAVMLIVLPSINVVRHMVRTISAESVSYASTPRQIDPAAASIQKPDIYFILLDAYGRSDVIKDIYGVDNSAFIDGLRQRGFSVPTHNTSNYYRTVQSLISTLNGCYLNELKVDPFGELVNPAELLRHSMAINTLTKLGYRFISYSSEVWQTEMKDADEYRTEGPPPAPLTYLLLDNTPLRLMTTFDSKWGFDWTHRRHIQFMLDDLPKVANQTQPTFTFAHILCPHPPFLFGKNGEPVSLPNGYHGNADGNDFFRNHYGTLNEYRGGYGNQVRFISGRILSVVDQIQQRSRDRGKLPPIIVIMGDHGPRSGVSFIDISKTNMREAFSNLMAIALPGGPEAIPDDASNVNVFPLILNHQFGMSIMLHENHCLYASKDGLDAYVDVTDRVRAIAPTTKPSL